MKMPQGGDGFTLEELMVVVLIIGILVAIAVPVFLSSRANAELNTCQANQRTIEGAVQTYNAQSTVTYPAAGTLVNAANVLVTGGNRAGATIKTPPLCPNHTLATQFYDTTNGRVDGCVSTVVGTGLWGGNPAHTPY
jgi:type IV pilus assembly protein PilA